jgi:hypothetical protein
MAEPSSRGHHGRMGGARSLVATLETLSVPVAGELRRKVTAWERRAAQVGMSRREALLFAEWVTPIREAWTTEACAAGWLPSTRPAHVAEACRDRDDLVCHVGAADGQVMHLVLASEGRRLAVVARRCFRGSPDSVFEHTWRNEDRLTREEIDAGATCRGCGRPFFGGQPFVPVLQRTPAQHAAIESEAEEFRSRHGGCHAGGWSVGTGGITHCSRCCAPPPLPAGAIAQVAAILRSGQDRREQLQRRWDEPAPTPTTASPQPGQARLDRLQSEARALGYRVVPLDDGAGPAS